MRRLRSEQTAPTRKPSRPPVLFLTPENDTATRPGKAESLFDIQQGQAPKLPIRSNTSKYAMKPQLRCNKSFASSA